MSSIPNNSLLRSALAWVLGWTSTLVVFFAAAVVPEMLTGSERQDFQMPANATDALLTGGVLFFAAFFITAYVVLVGPLAYCALDRFARVDRFGRRSWRAYCLAALAACIPYFVIFLVYLPALPVFWLAGPVAALAYGSISYWLVERGWPWQWRQTDEVADGWKPDDCSRSTT